MGNSAVREKSRQSISTSLSSTQEITPHNLDSVDIICSPASPRSSCISVGVDINARKLPTMFRWRNTAKSCYVSGSYDNWTTKIPLVKSQENFYTIIDLPEGTHQFKYYVDNQWICDPEQNKVPNTFGTENNIIVVRSTDFEVFEALGIDNLTTSKANEYDAMARRNTDSPPGDYCQIIPELDTHLEGVKYTAPPILPQQLLQVILNKEIPPHCEPTLLPEPNHVMLNHLYALSIKNGMMVLSATHRYRKKYITTLIYKPIANAI